MAHLDILVNLLVGTGKSFLRAYKNQSGINVKIYKKLSKNFKNPSLIN